MKSSSKIRYVAFLRGINVGGHHKVSMDDLRSLLEGLGFENVVTLLNSGNVIFDTTTDFAELEDLISERLHDKFGFPVPTAIRTADSISKLFDQNPFQDITITKDIRLYISFLRKGAKPEMELPWTSDDHSYTIMQEMENAVLSVLDLSVSGTPDAMEAFEKFYGRNNTTRNWKTVERIVNKL